MATEVKYATSFDERFNPKNVLDQSRDKFWITTGLYPQELAIELKKPQPINAIRFVTTGAKKIEIQGCKDSKGDDFVKLGESKEIANNGSGEQNESIAMQESFPVTFFKFIILDGWDDFTSVHSIQI